MADQQLLIRCNDRVTVDCIRGVSRCIQCSYKSLAFTARPGLSGFSKRLIGRHVQFTPCSSKYGVQTQAEDGFVHLHHSAGMLSKIASVLKQKQM